MRHGRVERLVPAHRGDRLEEEDVLPPGPDGAHSPVLGALGLRVRCRYALTPDTICVWYYKNISVSGRTRRIRRQG